MITFFYTLIIYPIEAVIEQIAVFANLALRYSPGATIVFLSVMVSTLTLPLYEIAEKWQQKERDIQSKLRPKIDKIKAVFKGDERYMMLSTYYRQNQYHPFYSVRSMFALFLQIPFFIAAYHFISNLEIIKRLATTQDMAMLHANVFYFIKNLGKPDALLNIGGHSIHVLPFAMTLINIISVEVYAKGSSFKDKIQLYVMALIFLVLLYPSPSALVLYWTVNNIYSLFKNLTHKYKIPLKVWYVLGVVALLITTPKNVRTMIAAILVLALILYSAVRFLVLRYKDRIPAYLKLNLLQDAKLRDQIFYVSIAGLFILMGALVPAALVASSPSEFSYAFQYASPFFLIGVTALQAAGIFLVWPVLLYLLFPEKVKLVFAITALALFVVGMIHVYFFAGDYGTLTSELVFSLYLILPISTLRIALSILTLVFVASALIYLVKSRYAKKIPLALLILNLTFVTIILSDYYKIGVGYAELNRIRSTNKRDLVNDDGSSGVYRISRTGKNVMIFMLDRASVLFIPALLEDFPELKKSFDGFTLYENVASFCSYTTCGVPPLTGGYEYAPEAVDKRSDELLVDKHTEALLVLPRLFSEAGWVTTITDASWANYSWVSDNTIFEAYPNIRALNVEGRHVHDWLIKNNLVIEGNIIPYTGILRNLLRFSFVKASPPFLQNLFYNEGRYLATKPLLFGELKYLFDFVSSLDYLASDVSFIDNKNTFNYITNNATHTILSKDHTYALLSSDDIDKIKRRYQGEYLRNYYYANILTFRSLTRFLDDLRKENAYDNTRIILVSDHGTYGAGELSDRTYSIPLNLIPLLMVKDFNKRLPLQTDKTFMMNADTPWLATTNLPDVHPVNPFSKKSLLESVNKQNVHIYIGSKYVDATEARDKTKYDIKPEEILIIKNNVLKSKN